MTETADATAAHRRSLKVTTIATLGGVAAAFLSEMTVSEPTSRTALLVLFGVVAVELGLMRVTGVDVTDFSTKDHVYVLFMSFALWFITWAVLLSEGVTL